jgi:hypothetical protein
MKIIYTNNFWKVIILLISFGILFSFNVKNISAIGITPGRTTVNFEEGFSKEIEIQVLNNEHKNMKVMIMSMVSGDLNGSITLFNDYLDFLPSEGSKTLKFKVELPNDLSPGLHVGQIAALEVPKSNEENTFVGATIAVVSQLYVYVPCPGKCIEADLTVLDSEQNNTATFIIPVMSRGKLGIGETRAIIDIYNSNNDKVGTVETDTQPIPVGGRTELSAKWKADVPSGDYKAKITILFDGQDSKLEKIFTVGIQSLSIENIMVNNFQLGEIAKLQILVENKWNQQLNDVYANLLVYNTENQVMADVKSAPENIESLSKKELIAYWDTVGVKEGEYSGKLLVKYGQKSSDRNLILRVSENNLDVFGVGYTIKPQGTTKGVNVTFILIILVILLLIVNLAWFVFFRRFAFGNKATIHKDKIQQKKNIIK